MRKLLFVLTAAYLISSCGPDTKPLMEKEITQETSWEFTQANLENWREATVPGTVHQDLIKLGDIEDPFYGLNEFDIQWIEDKDWVYKTVLPISEEVVARENITLYFKGLDTYASVYLNDTLILEADNMFRSWEVDVKGIAKSGVNTLKVYFHSPVKKGMEKLESYDYLYPVQNEQAPKGEQTCVYTRKASYHYGWDWGPRLTTSGVWQKIYLRAWDKARISDTYWKLTELTKEEATFEGTVEIEASAAGKGTVVVTVNGESTTEAAVELQQGLNSVNIPLTIKDPSWWWPAEYGDQSLYDVEAKLVYEGDEIDAFARKVAACKVKVIKTPDETGEGFYVEVNDTPVFMKGANYIPGDNLIPRVSDEKYQRVIDEALAAHMNSLRVWGGAVYEKDIFYDKCLEHGIMLWHDFMFACSMYPANEAAKESIRLEAEEQVKRLRNYPNIYVWAGNNEVYGAWQNWNFVERFDLSSEDSVEVWNDYAEVFNEVLPAAVAKYNPDILYCPSSPQSADNALENGKSGDSHYWEVWFGGRDFESYREETGRFFSEYGFQSYPPMSTLRKFTPEDQLSPFSNVLYKRQRSPMGYLVDENGKTIDTANGNHNIYQHMKRYYKVPQDFEDYVYVSQLLHALAVKEAAFAHRREKPHTMGTMYWQINDCWPTISWSSIDYYGTWKATHYQARDAYKQTIVSPVDEEGELKVYVVSDKLEDQSGVLTISMKGFDGTELWSEELEVAIPANESKMQYAIPLEALEEAMGEKTMAQVYVSTSLTIGEEQVDDENFFFTRTKTLDLPETEIAVQLVQGEETIELSTDAFAHKVYIYHPTLGLNFTDNFFDLEKGEKKRLSLMNKEYKLSTLIDEFIIVSVVDTY